MALGVFVVPARKEILPRLSASDFAEAVEQAKSEQAVFLLLLGGSHVDSLVERGIARVVDQHRDKVRVYAAPAGEFTDRIEAWHNGRRTYDTFSFDRLPVMAFFRGGKLLTTFRPREVFFIEKLQEREVAEQFELFLDKMVFFDPEQVKEQKNLELEAGKPS